MTTAPSPQKSAPGFAGDGAGSGEHADSATLENQAQDRGRARRLLVVALGLIGEALDCAWHGDAEDVGLRAIRAAQTATHAACDCLNEEHAK